MNLKDQIYVYSNDQIKQVQSQSVLVYVHSIAFRILLS